MSTRGLVARAAVLLLALSGGAAHAVQDCDLNGERVNLGQRPHDPGQDRRDALQGPRQRRTAARTGQRNGVFMGAVRY